MCFTRVLASLFFAFVVFDSLGRAFDGCSPTIGYGDIPYPSSIKCSPECSAHCAYARVNTTNGQGEICVCGMGGTFSGCCTIALTPPDLDTGIPTPVGVCGGTDCPWSGTCMEASTLVHLDPDGWKSKPYCTGS